MDYLKLAYGLLNFFICIQYVRLLSMLTQGQVHVMSSGESVILDCEFYTEYFSLFDNPVIWTKYQLHEETQLNIMGNIIEPFVTTGRFTVTFDRTHPRYRLKLKISEMVPEDSGNYTCEIRGPRSAILGVVKHYIFVREGESAPLRCASEGGYPAPEMDIYLSSRDLTETFSIRHTSQLTGDLGMRRMLYNTERWSYNFRALAEDDGQHIRCVVTVPGLGSNTSTAKIHVEYAPIITCNPASAYVGEHNVYLLCRIRARPGVTRLNWAQENGTRVGSGDSRNDMRILNSVRGDLIETKLFMTTTTEESFRMYSVVAENSIAETTEEVELQEKKRPPTNSGPEEIVDSGRKQSSSSHGRRSESGGGYDYHSETCRMNGSAQLVLAAILLSAVFVHR